MPANILLGAMPMSTYAAGAGEPYTAQHSANQAYQVGTLAFRQSGNVRAQFFVTPDKAPRAQVITALGEAAMKWRTHGGQTPEAQWPWQMQTQYQRLRATGVFASHHQYPLQARLVTKTLVDAVSTTEGPWSQTFTPQKEEIQCSTWRGARQYLPVTIPMEVDPTLPASRRIAIAIEVRVDLAALPYAVQSASYVYLYNLVLVDEHVPGL